MEHLLHLSQYTGLYASRWAFFSEVRRDAQQAAQIRRADPLGHLPVRPRRAAADLGRGDPDRGAGRREAVGVLRGAGPRLQGARRSHNDTLWKDLGGSISP